MPQPESMVRATRSFSCALKVMSFDFEVLAAQALGHAGQLTAEGAT